MRQILKGFRLVLFLVLAGVLIAVPVSAKKPDGKEYEKYEQQEYEEEYKYRQYDDQDGYQDADEYREREKKKKGKKGYGHSGKYGKGKKGKGHSGHSDYGQRKHTFFKSQDREVVHDYYAEEFRAGRCPPGLAKKANGCMPPGQAKKWQIGRQLPREVIFHDLPPRVLRRLDPPPPRHRYVRVAEDILLITVGTGMVVDAIEDLGRIF